ncbi:MAG: DNA mismatch repair endonuclease MutL [Alphaproteobacteria bacterium]
MTQQKQPQKINRLNPHLINQIAAGEVIERPAAILKELVENAIDAGALKIDIEVEDGGKAFIAVHDNGTGIEHSQIPLAFERHATSKLADEDLFAINTFGFRGEALPSIASISRVQLITRTYLCEHAWKINVEGGEFSAILPHQANTGTTIEIRDIFYATPARLKFLKNSLTELNHCKEILSRLAMANQNVHFTFKSDGKLVYDWKAGLLTDRMAQVMGSSFVENTVPVLLERNGYRVEGLVSLPTYSRSQANDQYIYVNNRWVKDRNVAGILRVAYQDVLMNGRHPMATLFLTLDKREVDVNVHPAKTEVRFRDSQFIRSFLIQAVKQSLQGAQHASSPEMSLAIVNSFKTSSRPAQHSSAASSSYYHKPILKDTYPSARPTPVAAFVEPAYVASLNLSDQKMEASYPMGLAKAQIFETFIIAQTSDALLLVDQHAAHERIVYEELKTQYQEKGKLPSQSLMHPEFIELNEIDCEIFKNNQEIFKDIGFIIEVYSTKTLVIHSTPLTCHNLNLKSFIQDVLEDLKSLGESLSATEIIWEKLASKACNNSIRAGRTLSTAEMNALLRQMELTPKSAQCNHGRPTFVKLDKKSLEKLFERS